ncbi:hypothetical protein HYY75_09535, partial [bacterium]|nr:hypothetical protein [bacterium]
LILAPGGYALIRGKGDDDLSTGTQVVYLIELPNTVPFWGANGFVEILKGGVTIDFVRFGSDVTAPTTVSEWSGGSTVALPSSAETDYGKSIARNVNNSDTNASGDWTLRSFATAGGQNDVSSDVDGDGDGIPDSSEAPGSTFAGLPLYDWGARTGQKDIFIHIDYMNSSDPGVTPRKEALDKVKTIFNNHGYTIHFDIGNLYGVTPADYALENRSHQVPYAQTLTLGASPGKANIYDYKNTYMNMARKQIFFYCLSGFSQNADGSAGSSGLGELKGNDFIVTFGNWGLNASTTAKLNKLINIQASTIMHELGHNLGLSHGGDVATNYKPNYRSIMNYMYQINGLPVIGNPKEGDRYYWYRYKNVDGQSGGSLFKQYFPSGNPLDDLHDNEETTSFNMEFSDGSGVSAINEGSISEPAGLKRAGSVGVDYNGNGNTTDGAVSMDLNPGEGTAIETLNDFNDWAAISVLFQRTFSGDKSGDSLTPRVRRNDYLQNDHQEVIFETLYPEDCFGKR